MLKKGHFYCGRNIRKGHFYCAKKRTFLLWGNTDPIFTELMGGNKSSQKAAKSLINAVLNNQGCEPISEIIKITPQKVQSNIDPEKRTYRLDFEVVTDSIKLVNIEVQLSPFIKMTERNLLYSLHSFSSKPLKGQELPEIIKDLPKVISINFLDFIVRPDHPNFHQVVSLYYKDGPLQLASGQLEIHHIQLPVFEKSKVDYSNPLHCWLKALLWAHRDKLSLREVVKMDRALTQFCETEPGFKLKFQRAF